MNHIITGWERKSINFHIFNNQINIWKNHTKKAKTEEYNIKIHISFHAKGATAEAEIREIIERGHVDNCLELQNNAESIIGIKEAYNQYWTGNQANRA